MHIRPILYRLMAALCLTMLFMAAGCSSHQNSGNTEDSGFPPGSPDDPRASQAQAATTFRPLEVYLAAACIYLLINLCLAALGRWLEYRTTV